MMNWFKKSFHNIIIVILVGCVFWMNSKIDSVAHKTIIDHSSLSAIAALVDKQFDSIDNQLDTVDENFKISDEAFKQIEDRLDAIARLIGYISDHIKTTDKRFEIVADMLNPNQAGIN